MRGEILLSETNKIKFKTIEAEKINIVDKNGVV